MDVLQHLGLGFGVAFSPVNLLVAAIGAFLGTIVGVLPGLGPINGVAMLVPIAFAMNLPPETALILLAAVYVGAEYGGRITSILINVPGEAASVMTTLDGYPLARQGLASVVLSLSAWASFIGSTVAILGIAAFAPLVAKWALAFAPAEYFMLMIFAFCALSSLLGDKPVKGALAAAIGLAIASVGVDANSGVYRYTFDLPELADGIDFVVVVIGLFAIAEMLQMLENLLTGHKVEVPPGERKLFNLKELRFTWWTTIRSSLMGFGIGVLPGAGASVASAVAYANEKRLHEGKDPDAKFGKGDLRGLAAPEAANNGAATGSFIPMLTLGVPGSGTTAVMMGALTLYNITPGPVLFDAQPALVWGLIASLFIANVMLFVMNVPMVRVFASMLAIPGWLLVPGILAISFIGVYALSSSTFDLLLMVGIGVIGYFLRKMGMPMAPMVLGVVLGNLIGSRLRLITPRPSPQCPRTRTQCKARGGIDVLDRIDHWPGGPGGPDGSPARAAVPPDRPAGAAAQAPAARSDPRSRTSHGPTDGHTCTGAAPRATTQGRHERRRIRGLGRNGAPTLPHSPSPPRVADAPPTPTPPLEPDERSLAVTASLAQTAPAWLRGGNTIAHVGVLILFLGVAFLLRYAAEHALLPIELRLADVALGGVGLAVIGWRLRERRRGYGLSLQGADPRR